MKRPILFTFLIFTFFSCQPNTGTQPDPSLETASVEQTAEHSQPDTIPYQMLSFGDTISGNPQDPEAPTAKFAETWLVAQSADKELNLLIFQSLANETVFEAGNLILNSPQDAFEESKEWFFSDFKEVYADFKGLMGYDSETNMYAELNDGRWFTVSISSFSFTGGAHGNYGTSYLTIDVQNKKKLELEDVFKPGYEAVLVPLLEKKVREHFEMEPGTPLEDFLFENKIPVTSNFGLLKDGILFDYPPYEIASYAAGEIDLLVRYEEVREVLAIEVK